MLEVMYERIILLTHLRADSLRLKFHRTSNLPRLEKHKKIDNKFFPLH